MSKDFRKLFNDVEDFLSRPLDPYSPPKQIIEFEAELARFFDVKEAIAVSSGTAAIHCALAALDVGEGDEVLVPSLAVIMSVLPILYQNAIPVFIDSQPNCVDFDYTDLESKLSSRVKAVLPVHLWGCSYDMTRLSNFANKHKIAIVEDACQAHGSRWNNKYLGTWGDLGCFSMKDGKLLSTGEGGFIVTNNSLLAEKCKSLRNFWFNSENQKLSYKSKGYNYRLTEIQALLAKNQLNCMEEILKHRQWQTQYILEKLINVPQLESYNYRINESSNFFSPVLFVNKNISGRKVAQELSKRNVLNSVGTFGLKPVHEWDVFNNLTRFQNVQGLCTNKNEMQNTPNVLHFLDHVIAIVLLPHYLETELDWIVATVKTVLQQKGIN
jgi:perosamine synthetase